MKPEAVQIIRDEHLAISAVLYSLRYLVKGMRKGEAPNFPLLRAILDYIVSYPDRWHHPKRTSTSSPPCSAARAKRTDSSPASSASTTWATPWSRTSRSSSSPSRAATPRPAKPSGTPPSATPSSSGDHLRTEEDALIPIAERVLTAEDWAGIAIAFRENDNPLFGIKPKDEAETLYQRILSLTPAPLGMGGAA
uniref:Uncharacterized protein n=1 Tax=Aromatoleum evansii TaxID=59406 RepID=Q84HH4_AROEV|nr:unknown [Aromatoleum evansii]